MIEMGLDKDSIILSNENIEYIIDKYTNEGGVRKLKNIFYTIIRELNVSNLTGTKFNNKKIKFPYEITSDDIKLILKNKNEITIDKISNKNKSGVINGMFASSNGVGGILPIEIMWIPTKNPLEIKSTGNLQLIIKESVDVAATLAFNCLDIKIQNKYLEEWVTKPKGLHVHCPDGSVPKDGPSAGTALTVAIYSLLVNKHVRNDIAITGEINLQGNVTAIGGLENKLEGAKKAGITMALYPTQNEKDIIKIKERNPNLIDETFNVNPISTIKEALDFSLV
jgi:ATP-dependent Lon protease